MPIEEIKQEDIVVKKEKIKEEETEQIVEPEEVTVDEEPVFIETENSENKSIKKFKNQQRDTCKNLLDIIDLPEPNLSESDSSDESDSIRPSSMIATLAFIPNTADDAKINDDSVQASMEGIEEDEIQPPPPVDDIWEKFKSYQASQIQKQSLDDVDEVHTESDSPPILHVVQSDHDYGTSFFYFLKTKLQTLSNSVNFSIA